MTNRNPYTMRLRIWSTVSTAGALAATLATGLGGCDAETDPAQLDTIDVREIELETEDFTEHIGENMRILAQMRAPGGSLVAFIADEDNGVIVLEHGVDGTSPISDIPELGAATAYETFVAIAAEGTPVPEELEQAHITARGSLDNLEAIEDFELREVPGFGSEVEDIRFRAFSSCTNDLAWALSNSSIPKFYNCAPDNVGICMVNKTLNPQLIDSQTGWKKNQRFSTCFRGGDTAATSAEFSLTEYYNGTFFNFFKKNSSAPGAYYRIWRKNAPVNKRWRVIQYKKNGAGSAYVNTSLWGRNYFPF